jgi:antitoxin YokJ
MTTTSLARIIANIAQDPDCAVAQTSHQPTVADHHRLPDDVVEFNELCGGIVLFETSQYPLRLVSADRFRPANPEIVGQYIDDDISEAWYIVGEGRSGEYVTIDLSADRNGRCYDSYVDRHAVAGSCAVIATSLTQLLTQLLAAASVGNGGPMFWLAENFIPKGDAYD